MQPTDETLIIACRRGDGYAWDLLVERYQRLIYGVARNAGLDQEQAADTLQDVFTILLERLDSIEQPAQLGAWLAITARREAWRASRRDRMARSRIVDQTDSDFALLPDNAALPDDLVLRLEAQHHLRLALEQLDARCRELLVMLFMRPEPAAYSEVAATLGMREGAVGPTRARCLQKLRMILGNEAP